MSGWTGALVAVLGVMAAGIVTNLLSEEVRARLDLLPRGIIWLAGRFLPQAVRDDQCDEWVAELYAMLKDADDGLPITRLLTGLRYACSLLRGAPAVARELTGGRRSSLRGLNRAHVAVGLACGVFVTSMRQVEGGWLAVLILFPLFVLPMVVARIAFARARVQMEMCGATMAALNQAMEAKDQYTLGHGQRVSTGSVMLARELGMTFERVEAIRYAGMLHDIGKLAVPTEILQKTGALREEEFAAIKSHTALGLEIVRDIGLLDEALAGIFHHHEKMDGRGYPMGLAGAEIPEFARVIAVVDAYDSMTSTRSSARARSHEDAIAELRRGAGDSFDPAMVVAFVRAVERRGRPL